MKEFILSIMRYEIYVWIISWVVVFGRLLITLRNSIGSVLNRKKNNHQIETNQNHLEQRSDEPLEENSMESLSITEKLLQHIDAEQTEQKEIPNKIELMEKEWYTAETIHEDDNTNEADIMEIKETKSNATDIYNIKTNHETINKQRSQFEFLKNEIELLKSRQQRVEYEKKLIQATIDFPDDYYFNSSLWDWYIESEDFRKAQTIFKKLHLQNESDDKVLYKLWTIHLELWDAQSAEYILEKAKDLKPENPKYYQALAEIKYNLEKIEESIELMEKAVDLRPTKFEYIEILWKLYKETDNIQLYYKTLLKMNALEPLNQRVRWELSKFQD